MVMMDLLTNNCGKDCKAVIREQVRKRTEIILAGFFAVALIISLCIVVGVLHEKKKISTHMDCVLSPTLETAYQACSFVDQYPLSNEIYARICVNKTTQLDIRRYLSGKPGNEGITLIKTQLQYLKKSIDHIDESISKAQKRI